MPATISAAIAAGFASLSAGFTIGNAVAWALKAGALLTLNHLLAERHDPNVPDITRTATFSSGPARWVLGRSKIGGVVAFWDEDWDVPGTERGGPGADDLHLVIALCEGDCDAIEAVWIGEDRFNVKFDDDAKTKYARREGKEHENKGFPLDLDPGSEAYFDEIKDIWLDKPGGAKLNPDDEDDAEKIRRASLSGAVSIWPYMNADDFDDTFPKFHSVRYYTDDENNALLNNDNGTDKEKSFSAKWTTDHKLEGISCVHIRLRQWTKHDFEARVFKQGAPNLSFLIRGLRITYPDPVRNTPPKSKVIMKTEWTDNAAAVRYWWHTVRRGILANTIDVDSFISAYKICDKPINPDLPSVWPGGTKPEWTKDHDTTAFKTYSINGVLTSGNNPALVESEFDDHWQGMAVEDGGKLYYYPGAKRDVEENCTVSSNFVIGEPSLNPAPAIAQRINAVNITLSQSAWHDYKKHSLIEIEDSDKIDSVDQGFLYPKNLGEWRWVINPVAAYLLANMTLRRARHSKTITVTLFPGDREDESRRGPVKFLAMSVGKIYEVNIPEEGLNTRMMLLQKTINEDMTVKAVFVESPDHLYNPNFDLPELAPPPPYIPDVQGVLPPKPENLEVFPYTRTLNNYFIKAKVKPNNFRKIFRLTVGTEYFEQETDNNEVYFEISVPHQQMEMTARNRQGKKKSLPIRVQFSPDFSGGLLPAPVWQSLTQQRTTLTAIFKPEDYNTPITGLEIRYIASGQSLTTANWARDGTSLTVSKPTIVANQPIRITIQKDAFTASGQYTLFARFVTILSGVDGIRSEISRGRAITINTDNDSSGVHTQEESDLYFPGAKENLYQIIESDIPLMLPDRPDLNDIDGANTAYLMNGFVAGTSLTNPKPAWPFGDCEGYETTINDGNHRNTSKLLTSTDLTWYRTDEIDLGSSAKTIQVRAKFESFQPPFHSNISDIKLPLGIGTLADQTWQSGAAITSLVLPEATGGTSPFTYTLTGRPTGLVWTAATRTLSGTPSQSSGTGTAEYTARDSTGKTITATFDWTIQAVVTRLGQVSGIASDQITHSGARITWTGVTNATEYDVQYRRELFADTWSTQEVSSTTATLTGLTASTKYMVNVRAKNDTPAETGVWSAVSKFTTIAQTITIGTATFNLEASGPNAIVIKDMAATNASGYGIRIRTQNTNTWSDELIVFGKRTHTVIGLVADTVYNVQIRGRLNSTEGDWSATKAVTTDDTFVNSNPSKPVITNVNPETDLRKGTYYMRIATTSYDNVDKVEIRVRAYKFDGFENVVDQSGNIVESKNGGHVQDILLTVTGDKSHHDIITYPDKTTYHSNKSQVKFDSGTLVKVRVRKHSGNETTQWSVESDGFVLSGRPYPLVPTNMSFNTDTITYNNSIWTVPVSLSNVADEHFDFSKYAYTVYANGLRPRSWGEIVANDLSTGTQNWMFGATATYTVNTWAYHLTTPNHSSGRSLPLTLRIPLETVNVTAQTERENNAPSVPTNLQIMMMDHNSVLLSWDASRLATHYEIEHNGTPVRNINGIDGTSFVFGSLPNDTTLTFKIRAHNEGGNSAFADFDDITTPPETNTTPFAFASDNPMTLTRVSNSRTISYSFSSETTDVDSFQIRYYQSTDTRIQRNDAGLVGARYITIDNPHESGVQTFTGTFDPGYSGRYYHASVRAFVNAVSEGSSTTRGLSAWYEISNTESVTLLNNKSVSIPNVFHNGATLLTAPTLEITQSFDDQDRPVITGTFNNLYNEWEQPTATDSWIDVDMETVVGALDQDDEIDGTLIYYDAIGQEIVDEVDQVLATKFVFTKTTPSASVAGDQWNFKIKRNSGFQGSIDSNVVNHVVSAQPSGPTPITTIEHTIHGDGVRFSWAAVADVDGYEVSITEPSALDAVGSTETIVQTSAATTYLKSGGRNEIYVVNVRSYTGNIDDRVFSDYTHYAYAPKDAGTASIQKIRSLTASVDGSDTNFQWGTAIQADGYEYAYSTDDGATWSTIATTSDTDVDITDTSDLITRVRGIAGRSLSTPFAKSNSWSTISRKADTSPSADDVGDIRLLTAISKNNKIVLEWTAADNATHYEIETEIGGTWEDLVTNIGDTDYETTVASNVSRRFRVRGFNDSDEGEWTVVTHTADTAINIEAPTVDTHATYQSIGLNWGLVGNATSWDIEYRKVTTPVSAWVVAEHSGEETSITIDELEPNTAYNVQVRGKDGVNNGTWCTETISTMFVEDLPAPSSITLFPGEDVFTVSWSSVAYATGYQIELTHSGTTTVKTLTDAETQFSYSMDDFTSIVRPVDMVVRIKSLFHDYTGSEYSNTITETWDAGVGAVAGAIGSQVSTHIGGISGASIPIDSTNYHYVENQPPNQKARPFFSDAFDTLVWRSDEAIEAYQLPYPTGGTQPYAIEAQGIVGGITFDESTRTFSGTPTETAPRLGYMTIRLTDKNDLLDSRPLQWVVANNAPNAWIGTGTYADPYEIIDAMKFNVRSLLNAGATNASDIESDTTGARGCVVWFVCRTDTAHITKLADADTPDFDMVVKRSDEFFFSDTTDEIEFIETDGHRDGSMIGIYKYASTTTTTGANNTGSAMTLAWYPNTFDAPDDVSGEVGGAIATGYSDAVDTTNTQYESEQISDVWLLSKAPSDTTYTKRLVGTLNSNGEWTAYTSNISANRFRLEIHLKTWRNRAMTGFTTEWKEI